MAYSKFKIMLFSENPDKLVDFYTTCLGFHLKNKLTYERDYGYSLEVAPGYSIWLGQHSKVLGYNRDLERIMINLYCDNLDEMYNKAMKYPGVKSLQEPIGMEAFNPEEKGRRVGTVLDPEGNCIQFMTI